MKYIFFILVVLFLGTSKAWVNEVFFIRGKIRSYDRKSVQIETETKMIAQVPRQAISEKFKLETNSMVTSIPVASQQIKSIKWKPPKFVRLVQLRNDKNQIIKELEQDYERLLKSHRKL